MLFIILQLFMKRSRKIYSHFQLCSAVLMILALCWLTVSTPFVYAAQQQLVKLQKMEKAGSQLPGSEEESSNPYGNTTEEKAPNSTSLSEEYIHHNHKIYFFSSIATQYHKGENAAIYIAFHGELLVPPPNLS